MLSKLFSPAAMELNLKAQDQEKAFRELVGLVPHLDEGGRAGLLLLWESWLRHEVLPGAAKADRLSISFNFA